MKIWKEYPAIRIVLIALLFLGGMILVIDGWSTTGQLTALGEMLIGVALLLCALAIYNHPYSK